MKIEETLRHFHYTILGLSFFYAVFIAHSQDQSGFISLDCGLPVDHSNYSEAITGINYISDEAFINTGVSKSVLASYRSNLQHRMRLRSFPEGIRNCYTINIEKGTKYLIRATFLYGNYDSKDQIPIFDIHLGPNFWVTVRMQNMSVAYVYELIHVPLQNLVRVCLVNTQSGTPFVTAIELRPLKNTTYDVKDGSLALVSRRDIGSTPDNIETRFPMDVLDRMWWSYQYTLWRAITTSLSVRTDDLQAPSKLMRTASTPKNESESLVYYVYTDDDSKEFYVYLHFAELEQLKSNESRAFDVRLNERSVYENVVPHYLISKTLRIRLTGNLNYYFYISKTMNSTKPPILNAVEVYRLAHLSQPETDQDDVGAITKVKSAYGVGRNWDGDPCFPFNYTWVGLNCTLTGSNIPRITSMNLSSSGLSGDITTHISELVELESLDLSNNSLTGLVPDFLSQMSKLKVLNLRRNNLTGLVPERLVERSKNGSLSISIEENPDLGESLALLKKNKKKASIVIPVATSISGLVILLIVAAVIFIALKNKKKPGVNDKAHCNLRNDSLESQKRQFSYSEVVTITNNFERILGKGGFGTVYYGLIDNVQVAVKILSASSAQGFQQFQAEVKLLMRVHHRNLTILIGYCNEGTNLALIYEYMANGSLDSHLSGDTCTKLLSWEGRLQIALDAAQGLEYLHSGCKPAIVHRDVKTANILLNENFEAKIADFGLSKFFPTDGATHVSTVPVGTPGYLDPEYYMTHRLVEASDVFSFGVVLLEIITSRPVINRSIHEQERVHISQWVKFMVESGDVKNIVDPELEGDFEINSAWKAVEIAMACVSKKLNMSQVVTELKECLASELARRNANSGPADHSINSNNELLPLHVTISQLHPHVR